MVKFRKRYHKNGKLWIETPYVDVKKHGIEKEYDENGNLMSLVIYEDGIAKEEFYRAEDGHFEF